MKNSYKILIKCYFIFGPKMFCESNMLGGLLKISLQSHYSSTKCYNEDKILFLNVFCMVYPKNAHNQF